jgi:hypothetical protein
VSEPTAQPQWFTGEQVQEAIAEALRQHAAEQAANASESAQGTVSVEQVQGLINAALAEQAEAHNKTLQALAASMRGSVASLVPEHSGGEGTEIAETWSAYEQGLAKAAAEAKAA